MKQFRTLRKKIEAQRQKAYALSHEIVVRQSNDYSHEYDLPIEDSGNPKEVKDLCCMDLGSASTVASCKLDRLRDKLEEKIADCIFAECGCTCLDHISASGLSNAFEKRKRLQEEAAR